MFYRYFAEYSFSSGALEQHLIVFASNLPFGTGVILRVSLHREGLLHLIAMLLPPARQDGCRLFPHHMHFKRID
ncbi:hypothetical protein [Paenibacillus sp. PL91]|uniref:hypothetical protein n=1 Tax=Paenibacillus sp. PL91 TaxID=2729538 RepID=UPI0016591B0D|nr:hypothetical protein [Paenibacillus sp. PL91]MBC9203330.1 hypothetical protein [Paenibacillus sp. PL91]